MVDFESQNAEKPFVAGTHYNGSETSGYGTPDNSIKAIHTRSGHILKFTEDESIIITDKSGNEIHLDTTGSNINITAPETMTFTAKNMNFLVAENITTTAGMNISTTAGINISEGAGANHAITAGGMMVQNAVMDYSLMAANITEIAKGDRKSKANKVHDQSQEKSIVSQNKNEIHTKGTFDNNSGENSKHH